MLPVSLCSSSAHSIIQSFPLLLNTSAHFMFFVNEAKKKTMDVLAVFSSNFFLAIFSGLSERIYFFKINVVFKMVPKISLDINYITFGDTRKKEQIFLYTNDSLIYDLKTGRCPLFLFKIRVAVS